MSQRGCASCPFLGMSFDRQSHASYPHHKHVCWAVAEPRSVSTALGRWIGWRPWQAGESANVPWQPRPFSSVASSDQMRCLGTAYAACPRFPAPGSLLRRLTTAAGGLRPLVPRVKHQLDELLRDGGDFVPCTAGDL